MTAPTALEAAHARGRRRPGGRRARRRPHPPGGRRGRRPRRRACPAPPRRGGPRARAARAGRRRGDADAARRRGRATTCARRERHARRRRPDEADDLRAQARRIVEDARAERPPSPVSATGSPPSSVSCPESSRHWPSPPPPTPPHHRNVSRDQAEHLQDRHGGYHPARSTAGIEELDLAVTALTQQRDGLTARVEELHHEAIGAHRAPRATTTSEPGGTDPVAGRHRGRRLRPQAHEEAESLKATALAESRRVA